MAKIKVKIKEDLQQYYAEITFWITNDIIGQPDFGEIVEYLQSESSHTEISVHDEMTRYIITTYDLDKVDVLRKSLMKYFITTEANNLN